MRVLDLLHDGRLQFHLTEAINLSEDVVVTSALNQANIAHLGSGLQRALGTLDLHSLGNADGIPVMQDVTYGVLDDGFGWCRFLSFGVPLMRAFRANQQRIKFLGVLAGALWARRQRIRHGANSSYSELAFSNGSNIEQP